MQIMVKVMCRFVTSVEHFYWVSFNLLLDFDINEDCVPTSKSHMELDSFSENRLKFVSCYFSPLLRISK